MKTLSFTAIALVGAMSMSEAAINFTAVGEYDAAGANTVDASATALNVSTFTGMVQTAFNSGTGGVINFDNRTGDSTGSAWGVSYNGGAGTLNFTLGVSAVAFQSAAIDATPISGSGYFRLTGTSTAGARVSNQMTFAAGSYLSSFGFTFLARNAAIADVYITGTYNDDTPFVLYNSASPFSNAAVSSPGNSATPDTFIGFTATDGKAIKTLNINLPANTFPVIDDFGFIVSPIPEPSASLLSLAGVAALASRRRRA